MPQDDRALKAAVSSVLYRFKQIYPNIQVDAETASAWMEYLSDVSPDAIVKAGKALLLNSEYPTLPGIGIFRRMVEKFEGKWISSAEALSLAQKYLAYNPRGYPCGLKLDKTNLAPAVKALVKEAAHRFGHDQLDRKLNHYDAQRFERIYNEVCLDHRMAQVELTPTEEKQLALQDTKGEALA